MKLNRNNKALLLIILLTYWSLDYYAQISSEKSRSERYAIDKGTYLELSNKYGDIEIETWEKDSVQIDVHITVYSDKYDWRKKMMQSIEVDFTASSGFIVVETHWDQDASLWRKSTYKITEQLGPDRIEVNYQVKAPVYLPLELENRFGNIFMGSHDAAVEVKVHHGDFRARHLKSLKKLDVRYGKAKIRAIEKGNLTLGSGASLDLDKAEEMMLSSASAEIEIGTVKKLNLRSKHDDIYIEEIGDFQGNLSLSDLKIAHLMNNLEVESKFGTLRIQEVDGEARHVKVRASKTDVILGLGMGFRGRFEIDVDKENMLSIPNQLQISQQGLTENKRHAIQGRYGDGMGTLVHISATNAHVSIGE